MTERTRARAYWGILAFAAALRLYGLSLPLLDSHQNRQVQTAMVARNLAHDNLNLFCTRVDFFGPTKNCLIMEFPLFQAIVAAAYRRFGMHDSLGRLVSIVFSIASVIIFYRLALQFISKDAAIYAVGLYALSPLNVFFGHAFMPEAMMYCLALSGVYLSLSWLRGGSILQGIGGAAFLAIACLVKPTCGIFLVPVIAEWVGRGGWREVKSLKFWLYLSAVALPVIAWGAFAQWTNSRNASAAADFWSWRSILFERGGIVAHWLDPRFYFFLGGSIGLTILTPVGVAGAIAGLATWPAEENRKILFAWLAAVVAYFFVMAGANSGHIYYHLQLLAPASILFGKGACQSLPRWKPGWWTVPVVLAHAALFIAFFSYMYDVRSRMPYAMEVASIVRSRLPPRSALVVNEDCHLSGVLAYYADAFTWESCHASADEAISMLERRRSDGAIAYVAIDSHYGSGVRASKFMEPFWMHLNSKYRPLAVNEHYLIFDLRKSESLSK